MTLTEIIERVARRQEVSTALVSGFVLEAVEEIVRVLNTGEDVKIRGLGTIYWKKVPSRRMPISGDVPEGWMLKFKPSYKLRERRTAMPDNNDDGMTKLGVVLDDDKTKQASEGPDQAGNCPACQRKLDDAGACPVHGTEPLEPSGR